jgi:WD40 repeat protein
MTLPCLRFTVWRLMTTMALLTPLIPGVTEGRAGAAVPPSPPPGDPPREQNGPPAISPPISNRGRGGIEAVAFSPDGKTLASGNGEGVVRFYDPATGRERAPAWDAGTAEGINALAYSPDGKALAVGIFTEGVRLLDVATRASRLTLRVPQPARPLGPRDQQSLTALAYAPDGATLAGATAEGRVAVWDVTTGRLLALMVGPVIPPARSIPGVNNPGRPAWVTGLVYAPDGKSLATMGHEKVVRVWDPAAGRERFTVAAAYPAYSPDGKALAVGSSGDGTGAGAVALLDPATGRPRTVFEGSKYGPVAFVAGDKALVCFEHDTRTVRLWDVATGRPRDALRLEPGGVLDELVVSPDGRTVVLAGFGPNGFFGLIELIETDGERLRRRGPGR